MFPGSNILQRGHGRFRAVIDDRIFAVVKLRGIHGFIVFGQLQADKHIAIFRRTHNAEWLNGFIAFAESIIVKALWNLSIIKRFCHGNSIRTDVIFYADNIALDNRVVL